VFAVRIINPLRTIPHYSKGAELEDGSKGADPMNTFRVIVKDGNQTLADRRIQTPWESGAAADIVLDELAHPEETRLELEVTQE
jgi:hypothetical protein